MKYTGTLKTAQPSSSEVDHRARTVTLHLTMPQAWSEMTQPQLRYVLWLMATVGDPVKVKTMAMVRFLGLTVIRKTRRGWKCAIEADGKRRAVFLSDGEIEEYIHQLDYTDTYENMDCRLDAVCGLTAAGVLLTDLSLGEYLQAEKYYQAFFINGKTDASFLEELGRWLYHDKDGLHAGEEDEKTGRKCAVKKSDWKMDAAERLGTFLWFSYVKSVMARQFPHFFKKASGSDDDAEPQMPNIIEQYNIQVRALTNGDVTKEPEVLATPCWRALTELDAKAREAAELEKIRNKH